jgi:hypothetical protein
MLLLLLETRVVSNTAARMRAVKMKPNHPEGRVWARGMSRILSHEFYRIKYTGTIGHLCKNNNNNSIRSIWSFESQQKVPGIL